MSLAEYNNKKKLSLNLFKVTSQSISGNLKRLNSGKEKDKDPSYNRREAETSNLLQAKERTLEESYGAFFALRYRCNANYS